MTELVYGLHPVTAALKYQPDALEGLWVERERRDQRIQKLLHEAEKRGVAVKQISRAELDRLTGHARHQGVAARTQAPPPAAGEAELEGLLAALTAPALLLVLDGIQDPHNLGACLRSADAAGAQAVVAPRDKAVGLTPAVRKVACGAAETVPFVQVTNLARTLRRLQEQGIWLVGTAKGASRELFETDLTGPIALVLGAEDKGLRRLTRESCDLLVGIPMVGQVESLNVSVATGICLFEALRQRRQKP
ncbi:MAG: 23S rRNA (guanosine(2251)-2'-O)-methyltransferase RlmB [Candidatus Competibacteraceae bacterium]|nr:23S rRNA (guanosine(2251)-2'-O)-methyltransferase RlmB [Candidatus Competibacteraceae bacterium]